MSVRRSVRPSKTKNKRKLTISDDKVVASFEPRGSCFPLTVFFTLHHPPQISEKKASEYEMMSGKLMKDVERLEKQLDQAVSDMNDMNKLMEQTLEFFSSG